jgi:putative DNA primase/helicase
MRLYRGFIPTKNKKSLVKFKNAPLKSFEEVQNLPEYAGVLGQNTVLVDVDDSVCAHILLKIVQNEQISCRAIKTTRGIHFLFDNNGKISSNKTACRVAVGIDVDIKIGSKCSYEVLKFGGVVREVLYKTEKIEEIPVWLLPISAEKFKFHEMGTGDGRNNSLFLHRIALSGAGFPLEDVQKTLGLINEYVLKSPLPKNELQILARELPKTSISAKSKYFFNKKFLFENFSRDLIKNLHIIKINDKVHVWSSGIFTENKPFITAEMLKIIPNLSSGNRREVHLVNEIIAQNFSECDKKFVAFNNGILNIETLEFLDFSPEIIIKTKIPHNFNLGAVQTDVDAALLAYACGNSEVVQLLEEVVGYCMFRKNIFGKAFILTGSGANGKSTFLSMIKRMLGEKNVASLDISALSSRFKTAELFGKLANIGDDIGAEFIANSSIFKKLVTGDRLNVERKGQDPFEFSSYAKLLFAANAMPIFKDTSFGLLRRLVIIPFCAIFSKSSPNYDPFFTEKIKCEEAIERLILLGICGLRRLLKNLSFTEPAIVVEALKNYERENDPLAAFADVFGLDSLIGRPTEEVFMKFLDFCSDEGFSRNWNKIVFCREFCRKFNLKTQVIRNAYKLLKVFVKNK